MTAEQPLDDLDYDFEDWDEEYIVERTGRRRDLLIRGTLFVLCLLLSVETLAIVTRWRANRDRLQDILRESTETSAGVDAAAGVDPEAGPLSAEATEEDDVSGTSRRIAFERTPHHAKLTVARSLVYQAMAGEATTSLPLARELALEVLQQQPNNWQASMFLGAATYLERSLRSDRRLYTAAAEWEQPLLEAMEQARGQPEPRRFLAAAYLETWAALSEAKKASALDLVRAMFQEDPDSFDRLGPVWLEVAGDLEHALDVIPDRPGPWLALEKSFAQKHDWEAFCQARGRAMGALKRELSAQLAEAEQRLRLGDVTGGRQMCLTIVTSSPRDGSFTDLVSRALELYPPGLHGLRARDTLKAWLHWTLELNALGTDPFSPTVVRRLTDAIGELDPPTGALAALVADDVYHIDRYKKLADSMQSKEWAPFLITETRWLIDRDTPEDLAAAGQALGSVHRSARNSAPYWLTRQQLARATSDLADLATADDRLAAFQAKQWQASDWRWRGRRLSLELYPEVPATGLALTIGKTPPQGAVAELVWDGTAVGMRPVSTGQTIELTIEIEPRPHQLELRSLAGGEVQPGPVRLLVAR